jgi:hypothetical protein
LGLVFGGGVGLLGGWFGEEPDGVAVVLWL